MEYLHKNRVEHRDLKAANCLLDRDCRVKLADFGLSKTITSFTRRSSTNYPAGTYSHMCPELLLENKFTQKADVYSYGIVMFEVLSRAEPWKGLHEAQIAAQIIYGRRPSREFPIPEDSPPELITLMEKCWDDDPSKRPPFQQIVQDLQATSTTSMTSTSPSLQGLEEKSEPSTRESTGFTSA